MAFVGCASDNNVSEFGDNGDGGTGVPEAGTIPEINFNPGTPEGGTVEGGREAGLAGLREGAFPEMLPGVDRLPDVTGESRAGLHEGARDLARAGCELLRAAGRIEPRQARSRT